MSAEHPIVAITGSSGAGFSVVIKALEQIFYRERVKAVYIDGSAFHRYDRKTMRQEIDKAKQQGRVLTHFGPDGNHLDKLESLFFQYAATGTGLYRHYLHTSAGAAKYGQAVGTFTRWQPMDSDNDLLVYRGLHGAAIVDDIDLSQYPDLHIGMAPNANLEWMRKLQRDTESRGYTPEEVEQAILDRLYDYVHYITPQFSRTHINFQMIPVVDTSNPFGGDEAIPSVDDCYLVIRFASKYKANLPALVADIPTAYVSRRNTLVVPGSKMVMAIELILIPIIHDLIAKSRQLRNITSVAEDRGAGLLGVPA